MVVRNFFTPYVLTDQTPLGREIAEYEGFGPFWPRKALGTWINSGRKTEKKSKQPPRREIEKSEPKPLQLGLNTQS